MTNSSRTKLTVQGRALIDLAVRAARGDARGISALSRSGKFDRLPKRKIVETILEIHLFAGFPATIEAFFVLEGYRAGLRSTRTRRRKSYRADGIRACRKVYGDQFENLILNLYSLNPNLADWVLEHGYGRVLSRTGLSVLERELVAIGVLASGGWKRQLISHLRACISLGASESLVEEAILRAVKGKSPASLSGIQTVLQDLRNPRFQSQNP